MRGFTFIETLITIAIFTLAMGAICASIIMIYRSYGYTWQQSRAIAEARQGVETMVKEIRGAKPGDDGSYPIALASNKEFIFFSDIDKDGDTERVRYFLGSVNSGTQTQECVTFADGGSCSVVFSDFLQGELLEAQVSISVEGDFSWGNREYAEIFADGQGLDDICRTDCSDCPYVWEGTEVFDVTAQAEDDNLQLLADATWRVNDVCDWIEPDHAMKVRFELSWTEDISGADHEFKKGIINPTASPIQYPLDQEQVTILSSYVRNAPPIFTYFDSSGQEIIEAPARLIDTKMIRLYLIININPRRAPQDFELQSTVQLRNLKTNL